MLCLKDISVTIPAVTLVLEGSSVPLRRSKSLNFAAVLSSDVADAGSVIMQ